MKTYGEALAAARDGRPFSNGTSHEIWSAHWCDNCHQPDEKKYRRYMAGKIKRYKGSGCPLLLVALMDKTPAEWFIADGKPEWSQDYTCIEYRGPDDGGGREPRARPDPPDMDGLFERPERRVRMLKQPEPVRELVDA